MSLFFLKEIPMCHLITVSILQLKYRGPDVINGRSDTTDTSQGLISWTREEKSKNLVSPFVIQTIFFCIIYPSLKVRGREEG